ELIGVLTEFFQHLVDVAAGDLLEGGHGGADLLDFAGGEVLEDFGGAVFTQRHDQDGATFQRLGIRIIGCHFSSPATNAAPWRRHVGPSRPWCGPLPGSPGSGSVRWRDVRRLPGRRGSLRSRALPVPAFPWPRPCSRRWVGPDRATTGWPRR